MKRILFLLAAILAFAATTLAKSDTIRLVWEATASFEKKFSFKGTDGGNFTVNWGDGNTENITATDEYEDLDVAHTYSKSDLYQITLSASDTGDSDSKIRVLNCSNTQVSILDLSNCTSLISLDCRWNRLTTLGLSNCPSLKILNCENNKLTTLDISNLESLMDVNCSMNQLTSLNASNCTSLKTLNCSYNNLTSFDVRDCALLNVNCSFNKIPLSTLYKLKHSEAIYGITAGAQSDSITLLINQSFDLSTERMFDNRVTNFHINAPYDEYEPSELYMENEFVFQFHIPGNYSLVLSNSSLYGFFIWYISVVKELPTGYFTAKAISNNSDWGLTTITGYGTYKEGQEVTFSATPNEGYRFVNWTKGDDVISTEAVLTLTIMENLELTANFEKDPDYKETFTVTLASNNNEWGSVSITGDGSYETGSETTISATPNDGFIFVNWMKKDSSIFATEAIHTFAVTENLELTANFEKRPDDAETFTVTLATNNAEWGRVSISGDGTYKKDEEVTITATPNEGFHFVNWTKDNELFATDAEFTFTATENLELTANFEKDQNNVGNESQEENGFRVYAQDRVIYLSEHSDVQVYNTIGQCLYSGHSTAIPVRQSGIYIVKAGTRIHKAIVR
ncbi:MAG: InlB B-repeat-containing protein [Bacteroides sp.]|nr:InlB B-repeat-containing protein [Bacteroides sp.]MCM1085345.1 InlB B-repeat-containing protein [Bacteroides sp.]